MDGLPENGLAREKSKTMKLDTERRRTGSESKQTSFLREKKGHKSGASENSFKALKSRLKWSESCI